MKLKKPKEMCDISSERIRTQLINKRLQPMEKIVIKNMSSKSARDSLETETEIMEDGVKEMFGAAS